MKTSRIVTVTVPMVASTCTLHLLWAKQVVNISAHDNGEEQSHMTNEKVIMLIEAHIQPQHRAELVEAARQYAPLVRAEFGRRSVLRHGTIPIHLFSTNFTDRKQHTIFTCSRTLRRTFWRR
jgi:hypothetical protein